MTADARTIGFVALQIAQTVLAAYLGVQNFDKAATIQTEATAFAECEGGYEMAVRVLANELAECRSERH